MQTDHVVRTKKQHEGDGTMLGTRRYYMQKGMVMCLAVLMSVGAGAEVSELTEGKRRVKKQMAISRQNLVGEGKVIGDRAEVDMNTTAMNNHRGGDND